MAAPDPSISLKKEHSRSKLPSNLWRNVLLDTLPVHPSSGISSWAAVLILRVPKELLPWPPEVDLDGWVGGLEGGIREDIAVLDDRPAGRVAVLSTLGGHHAGLILHWLPHDHLAGLEDDRGVPEDEVDGARDGAGAVELAVGVGVEGVLVGVDVAVVDHGHVACNPKGHGLVLGWPGSVLDCKVPANEPFSFYPHRGGMKSAGPVDVIQASGDHHFGGVLSQENNVVHITRNTHDFFVHAGLDEDYNLAGVFGRDGGQSAVDGLKFPTSVLGNHNVGSNGVRGSTDFQGLKEVGELSDHSQGVAGELHGGFKEVLHFLAGIAGGVLEGIQAGLFESDGGAEPNLEDVTLFGVDGSRFLNLKLRMGNGFGEILPRHRERRVHKLPRVVRVISFGQALLAQLLEIGRLAKRFHRLLQMLRFPNRVRYAVQRERRPYNLVCAHLINGVTLRVLLYAGLLICITSGARPSRPRPRFRTATGT
nr:hypothetical protein ACMD2_20547 [Ipomoea batatas]